MSNDDLANLICKDSLASELLANLIVDYALVLFAEGIISSAEDLDYGTTQNGESVYGKGNS